MKVYLKGFNTELNNSIERICKKFGFLNGNTEVYIEKTEDKSLCVSYDGSKCVIKTDETSSVFRGLAILSDKIKKNQIFSICENKVLDRLGILIDLSRNAVLKNETMEDILDRIAVMGFNSAVLYMEDTFELEGYPYFGYMRGAYSKEDLKSFDKYAASLGIELIANIEVLSHLECPLSWSDMSKIKESGKTLLVDEPETYKFIEAMIKTISECFSGDKIFVGMDEAHDLGRFKHLDKYGYERPFDIFVRHIKKVCEITDKYHLHPVMADDMFHRMFGNGGYYQKDAVFPSDISDYIPEDISLFYWDYYNEDSDFITACIRKSQEIKHPMEVMGGIWTWSGSVNYDKTIKNAGGLIKACKSCGIKNLTATLWGDDGAEVSIYAALFGMQIFAEAKYGYSEDDLEHIKDMFSVCTGYNADTFLALDIDQIECDDNLRDCMKGFAIRANTLTKQATYQDILQGLFDYNLSKLNNYKEHYIKCKERLLNSDDIGDLNYLKEYVLLLCDVLSVKADMGVRFKKAYDNNDKEGLGVILKELEWLLPKIEELHDKFAQIWLKNNKAFGLDRSDLRFGGLYARTKRAYMRLSDYLSGKINSIEELEEKRLSRDGSENALISSYHTSAIISASQFR